MHRLRCKKKKEVKWKGALAKADFTRVCVCLCLSAYVSHWWGWGAFHMAFSALTILMRFAFHRGEPLGKSSTAYWCQHSVSVCACFCACTRVGSDKEQCCSFFLTLPPSVRVCRRGVTSAFVLKFSLFNCCELNLFFLFFFHQTGLWLWLSFSCN